MHCIFVVVVFLLTWANALKANAIEPGFYGTDKKETIKQVLRMLSDADRQIIVYRNGYQLPGLSEGGVTFSKKQIISFLKIEKHRQLVVFILHPVETHDQALIQNDLRRLNGFTKDINYRHVLVLGGRPDGWQVFQDVTFP